MHTSSPSTLSQNVLDSAGPSKIYSNDTASDEDAGLGDGVHLWFPVAPPGFRALGCVATEGPTAPDTVTVACLREEACVPSDLTETLRTYPESESDYLDLIKSGSGGTFFAVPRSVGQQGAWRLSDIATQLACKPRTPLGMTPLQLCQTVPWLLRDRERAIATRTSSGLDDKPSIDVSETAATLDLPDWLQAASAEAYDCTRALISALNRPTTAAQKRSASQGSSFMVTTAEFKRVWWSREPTADPRVSQQLHNLFDLMIASNEPAGDPSSSVPLPSPSPSSSSSSPSSSPPSSPRESVQHTTPIFPVGSSQRVLSTAAKALSVVAAVTGPAPNPQLAADFIFETEQDFQEDEEGGKVLKIHGPSTTGDKQILFVNPDSVEHLLRAEIEEEGGRRAKEEEVGMHAAC